MLTLSFQQFTKMIPGQTLSWVPVPKGAEAQRCLPLSRGSPSPSPHLAVWMGESLLEKPVSRQDHAQSHNCD